MSEYKLNYRKKLKHYNIPYHAHELTFSCYHRYDYLKDPVVCNILFEELGYVKEKFNFKIWAYVLMPNHVHLLIFPQHIKGKSASRYREYILDCSPEIFEYFCVISKGKKVFRLWQVGGGFDRNLWSAQAIHYSINYIEGNPVRAGLTEAPEEWMWSSARARLMNAELVSDLNDVPVFKK